MSSVSSKKYVLVVNLRSRQSELLIEEVKKAFKRRKRTLKVLAVKDPKNLNKAFQEAIDKKPDVIVLGGGDGTLISGIEYLVKNNYKKDIGLLPLGTANYLIRNLGIPLTVRGSVATLLKGRTRLIPLGVANGKYFALMFMLGITQAAAEQVSDKLKRKLGQLAYVIELIRQTKQHDAFRYTITLPDNRKPLKGTTHQIAVYNSDMNQQVKLMPDHRLERSTLKVVINKCGKSKWKFYVSFLVHIITFGKKRPYMQVFETKSLKISTTPKLTADYDGEPFSSSPFEVSVLDQKIRVIC